jgi:hypothetical protein
VRLSRLANEFRSAALSDLTLSKVIPLVSITLEVCGIEMVVDSCFDHRLKVEMKLLVGQSLEEYSTFLCM